MANTKITETTEINLSNKLIQQYIEFVETIMELRVKLSRHKISMNDFTRMVMDEISKMENNKIFERIGKNNGKH